MKLGGRSTWRVLGFYLAGGWVLLQVIDVLADNTGLPPQVFTLALVIMAGLREESELWGVPQLIRGVAMSFFIAGILSMAFMGFSGLFHGR